jgi:hypothetical protein
VKKPDTKMILHAYLSELNKSIVIKTVDTDVTIIALGNIEKFDGSTKIWMETGKN